MNRHLVLISDSELQSILSGKQEYLIKFFRKRTDFFGGIASGDLVYLRKKGGEVLAQFMIGKLIKIERLEIKDWKLVQSIDYS